MKNFGHREGPSVRLKTREGHTERTFVRFSSAMRHNSFRLACGHGSRRAFRCDAFAEPLIGIPLACHVGRAIDGRESLPKSASLVNFGGGVVFVTTSKFLLILPIWTCWCKKNRCWTRGARASKKRRLFRFGTRTIPLKRVLLRHWACIFYPGNSSMSRVSEASDHHDHCMITANAFSSTENESV